MSIPDATLPATDTYSDIPETTYQIPLSDAEQIALRPALLRDLGVMPFGPHDRITRSLWAMFIGESGSGAPEIGAADAHIYGLVRQAVARQAATGQGTAPRTFHVAPEPCFKSLAWQPDFES